MLTRVIVTGLLVACWGLLNLILHSTGTIAAGYLAGMQFDNSDASAVAAQSMMPYVADLRISTGVMLLILLAIWWMPLRGLFAVALLAIGLTTPAHAYYEKSDYAEAYTILPNESAFWIPDTGANKDSQRQFESEEYLQANRVPVKRFIVPHTKLQGSGTFFDYYVPAGRLVIVDRTPFSREWVSSQHRGTSAHDESIPCQSKEGLDISVGVSIGASVMEANAAKYLYRFGVLPPSGDRMDPRVIFNSVFYSRKLADVMDDVGRKKVQTLVCNEIASRTFDLDNEQADAIMQSVQKSATEYFASVGITLDFIGWGDTFTFNPTVQEAVNRRYIAKVDQANAMLLTPYAQTIQALAAADALRSFGSKTDGKLPTTIVGLPTELGTLLSTLLRSSSPTQ